MSHINEFLKHHEIPFEDMKCRKCNAIILPREVGYHEGMAFVKFTRCCDLEKGIFTPVAQDKKDFYRDVLNAVSVDPKLVQGKAEQ